MLLTFVLLDDGGALRAAAQVQLPCQRHLQNRTVRLCRHASERKVSGAYGVGVDVRLLGLGDAPHQLHVQLVAHDAAQLSRLEGARAAGALDVELRRLDLALDVALEAWAANRRRVPRILSALHARSVLAVVTKRLRVFLAHRFVLGVAGDAVIPEAELLEL